MESNHGMGEAIDLEEGIWGYVRDYGMGEAEVRAMAARRRASKPTPYVAKVRPMNRAERRAAERAAKKS